MSRFGHVLNRQAALHILKWFFFIIRTSPFASALPIDPGVQGAKVKDGMSFEDPRMWLLLSVAAALVLAGGVFAGLTIALMGQDEIYLQVLKSSGKGSDRKQAARVLDLLNKGKHWVLVTLLLSNVITNETLPIVLDRSLGGGWPAVLSSTVLIVIFGEIVPQSICVRYGLPIGAWMAPGVLMLMYVMSPIAFPVAVLLDKILGKGHGIVYKKAELKTLVYLHKSLGAAGEQLNSDEVTIISAVLDLKDKSVGSIMIPMEDVFTMSADSVLDEKMMDVILSQGYSRIPIHTPGNPGNFIGMLLVKMLITYDPEDCKQVKDFALATLPETRPETSCLDIVNFFQEGKSHMVLVSEYPGDDHGALGVVTLEDVIEELIGEEIIDESDVFIDVHKAIRRMAPAPKYRVPKGMFVPNFAPLKLAQVKASDDVSTPPISSPLRPTVSQDETTADSKPRFLTKPLAPIDVEGDQKQGGLSQSQIRKHLRHLGPSNPSSNPRQTRVQSVKIKPGPAEQASDYICPSAPLSEPIKPVDSEPNKAPLEFTRTTLLGQKVKGGARALRASYGALEEGSPLRSKESSPVRSFTKPKADIRSSDLLSSRSSGLLPDQRPSFAHSYPTGSSPMLDNSSLTTRSHPTKSGSITEQIVNVNGIRKVVLQPSSDHGSSDDNEASGNSNNGKTRSPRSEEERVESSPALEHLQSHLLLSDPEDNSGINSSKRKRKRRRKRTGKARK